MRSGGFPAAWILAGAMLGLAPEASAGPAVSTRWQETAMAQEECLRRAEDAIGRTGFGKLERTEQSRFGGFDDYTATIRCVTGNGFVVFIVAGPSRVQTDRMTSVLFGNFDAEPMGVRFQRLNMELE
jgi:hypothetical protein